MKNIRDNRWLSVIGIIIIAANITTIALLWGRKKYENPQRIEIKGPVFDYLTKELQLDSVQQEAYRKLRAEHQKGQAALQDNIRTTKDAFFALLKKADVTEAELVEKSKAAAAADEQFDLYTFKHFQKVRAICTPVQQQKFDSVIQDVLRRMAPKQGGGPPPGMPPQDNRNDTTHLNAQKNRPASRYDSLRKRFPPDSLDRRNHPPPGNRPPGDWPPPHDGPPGDRPPPRDGPPADRPPRDGPPRDWPPPPGDRPPPPND